MLKVFLDTHRIDKGYTKITHDTNEDIILSYFLWFLVYYAQIKCSVYKR